MSVVREILGVAQVSGTPTAAVMSLIAGGSTTTGAKKRKSFLKEAREVANLRDSEGLVISPPKTPEDTGPRHWRWKKFKNSAAFSKDVNLISHWDYRDDSDDRDYSAIRCNVFVELPELASLPSSVLSELEGKYKISIAELEKIFHNLKVSDLNFLVAADRAGLESHQVKDIYYTVFSAAYPGKKCKYSHEADIERRKILQEKHVSLATEGPEKASELRKREKELIAEIKELESDIKSLETEFSVVEKIINPEPPAVAKGKQKNNIVSLASAEKKIPGYDLVNKYIPGVVALNALLSGKPAEVPKTTIQMVGKQAVDFSALTKLPDHCTAFNSKKIMDFFATLAELNEQEKQLTAFIKKREAEIKALYKLDS